MKQLASIYYRDKKIIIRTMSNGPGAYVGIGKPLTLEHVSLSSSIGKAIVESLSRSISTNSVHLPENLSEITTPTLQAAGVKSWKEFIRGCKSIDIDRNNNKIQLRLLKREGTNFVLGPEPEILENPSPEELGVAVQRLFRIKPESE